MDIGLVLDKIRPGAKYTKYDTYLNLVNTWEDETACPTEQELLDEWELIENPVLTTEEKIANLDAKYEPILNDCLLKIGAAVGADGTTQDTKVATWQTEYKAQIANKKAERLVILNG